MDATDTWIGEDRIHRFEGEHVDPILAGVLLEYILCEFRLVAYQANMIMRVFKQSLMSKLSHPPFELVSNEMTLVEKSTNTDTALIMKLASECFSHSGDLNSSKRSPWTSRKPKK